MKRWLMLAVGVLMCAQGVWAQSAVKSWTDADIRRFRMGTVVVYAEPGARVTVTQQRHEFQFGAAVSSGIFSDRADEDNRARYLEIFRENFNAAVFENAMKWPQMQRAADQPVNYTTVDRILAFCDEHSIPIRGHNIYWGIERFVPDWLKSMDDATLKATLEERGRSLTAHYKCRVPEYDVNNEMLHGDYFVERLGSDINRDMFLWAKEGDPDAIMYLNDYDVLTGNYLDAQMAQVRDFLEGGIPVGGIGVQGHLHGETFDPMVLDRCLDSLSVFDLPIKVTEFNMPGQRFQGDEPLSLAQELKKAQDMTDYLRICFAHPAVEGVLYWGFWQGALWLPRASLWDREFNPLPAADAYRELVFGEWWTDWTGTADESGRCIVPVFYGEHEISVGGRTQPITLLRAQGAATVDLR